MRDGRRGFGSAEREKEVTGVVFGLRDGGVFVRYQRRWRGVGREAEASIYAGGEVQGEWTHLGSGEGYSRVITGMMGSLYRLSEVETVDVIVTVNRFVDGPSHTSLDFYAYDR